MAQPTYEQLLDVIAQKDRQIAQLEARNRELESRNRQLEAQVVKLQARVVQLEQPVEKTTRAGKRQAAPFSKGLPKKNPKKPGRKSGKKYGPKAHRSSHEGNRTFRNHLAKHREEILTFLYHDDIEATNWPAEQAMRPAVVNRRVFGCNRTPAGARAQEVHQPGVACQSLSRRRYARARLLYGRRQVLFYLQRSPAARATGGILRK